MNYFSFRIATAVFLCVSVNNSYGAEMQESTQKSIEYVRNLQTDCVLDHGYRCIEIEEDNFLGLEADRRMVPGPYLTAWQICYEDFKTIPELTDEQKELKHYKIGFTQNESHIIVLFQGLLLPEIVDGKPVGTIRSVFGLSTKYWVDKRTLEISERLFLTPLLGLCTSMSGAPCRDYGMKLLGVVFGLLMSAAAPLLHAFDTTLESHGSRVHVFVEDDQYKLSNSELVLWVRRSIDTVSKFYNRFPTKEAYIAISGRAGKGVLNGIALGDAGAVVNVKIGLSTDRKDLDKDWVLVHELVHLAFPKLHTKHHWVEEGIAVYVESIARAQAGGISAESVWEHFFLGMPNGLPKSGDKGLDNTPTWGRVYWGGALFFLLADIEIVKRSTGKKSLKDGLRAIVNNGYDITKSSGLRELLLIADREIGLPVLTELYDEMSGKPVPVDLDQLWNMLGVVYANNKVHLLHDAKHADIRKTLTRMVE